MASDVPDVVCVEVCPTGAIRLTQGEAGVHAEIDEERCRECEACVDACPEEAIMSEAEPIIEGELVPVEETPVPVGSQSQEVRLAGPIPKALTWLGGALAFAGREIVPRVAASSVITSTSSAYVSGFSRWPSLFLTPRTECANWSSSINGVMRGTDAMPRTVSTMCCMRWSSITRLANDRNLVSSSASVSGFSGQPLA